MSGTLKTIQFRATDLPTEFCQLPAADQLLLIRAATNLYTHMKDELFDAWNATDEAERAERWRDEGRREVGSEKRALAAALSAAEATAEALRVTIDRKVEERVHDRIGTLRAEYEMGHMREMLVLREKLATLEGKEKFVEMIVADNVMIQGRVRELERELEKFRTAATKSSHAIGKAGEAEVYDMLVNTVCPMFQFATVKDMSHVSHAADFHLTVMGEDGSKIKILVDSKKYNKPVTSAEIQKLHTDVDADDEARAGLLVSLQTHIQTAKSFQIRRTEKNRPVMYLTFQHTGEAYRGEILCWAVRVLQSIAIEKNISDQQHMIDKIELFLNSFNKEIKDMDMNIKALMKNVDAFKKVRNDIVHKITKFRANDDTSENGSVLDIVYEDESNVIEHISSESVVTPDVKCEVLTCSAIRQDGGKCRSKRAINSELCKYHGKRVT